MSGGVRRRKPTRPPVVEPAVELGPPLQMSAWVDVAPGRRVEITFDMPALDWWEQAKPGELLPAVVTAVTDIVLAPR